MTNRLCAALCVAWIALFSPLCAQAALLAGFPQQGRLEYDLMHGEDRGRIGRAEHAWQYADGRYQMALAVQTAGLLDAIYHFEYTQQSSGVQGADGLVPEEFAVLQTRRQDQRAHFDWAHNEVQITRKQRTTAYPIEAGTQDVLSIWHWVMQVKGGGKPMPTQMNVVTNRRVYTVAVEDKGKTRASIRGSERAAHLVTMRATNGKLTLDMWLDETLWWMPLRILMVDDKGLTIDQQITPESLTWFEEQRDGAKPADEKTPETAPAPENTTAGEGA